MEIHAYEVQWESGPAHYWHMRQEDGEILFSGKVVGGNTLSVSYTELAPKQVGRSLHQDTLRQMLTYFEGAAKKLGISYIEVSDDVYEHVEGKEEPVLQEWGYERILNLASDDASLVTVFLGKKLKEKGWIKEVTGDYQRVKEIREALEETIEEEIGMYVQDLAFSYEKSIFHATVTTDEKTLALAIRKREDQYYLLHEGENHPFVRITELKKHLKPILWRVFYRSNRERFEKVIYSYGLPKDTADKIYQTLLVYMDGDTIVEKCKEAGKCRLHNYPSFKWFDILGFTFVLGKGKQFLGYFPEKETGKIKSLSLAAVMDQIKEEVDSRMKEERKKIEERWKREGIV